MQELYHRLESMALRPSQRPATERWLDQQPPFSSLAPLPRRRSQLKRSIQIRRGRAPINQVATHPWGYLAEITCGSQGPAAEHQLAFWLEHGFRDFELSHWATLAGNCPAAMPWPAQGNAITLQVRGGDLNAWPTHAWLQHCPIPGAASIHAAPLGAMRAHAIALNLADLSPGQSCTAELLAMAALERVWDPNPERVRLLRQFGVNASWLLPVAIGNGALRATSADWAACSATLGLAPPDALRQLGNTVCLGSGGQTCDQGLQPPLLGVPGFDGLSITGPKPARLQALWLQGCLDAGLELVRFQPTPGEQELEGWRVLIQPEQAGRAPIVLPSDPMGASELLEELHWYRQGCPPPEACRTPEPAHRVLLERSQGRCHTAVCISLYNYGPRIHQALESVLHQEQASDLELIVVDDASTDNGAAVVQAWMAEHHSRFARCLLLQHTANGGLASTRNTAFAAAESPWCFVLDADNALDPLAVAHCSLLANAADSSCAVVHSLIRVQPEAGCHDPRQLVSDLPWQQEIFQRGNYIDAMALVRREAWQAVGGYTHIRGGWEDFDFWCCLIDAGWHGILCPQVLATYRLHGDSMLQSQTNNHQRRLSRLLQQRHPWLQLAFAAEGR